jgi:hypothetical protein
LAATSNDTEPQKPDAGRMDRVTTKRPPAHSEAPIGHPPEAAGLDAGFVNWVYLGAESVFFYPPGSEKEHLVVDHGIPSVDMHWQVKGKLYDHEGDHRKQREVALGAVGDLVASTHAHELTALPQLQVRAVAAALSDCSTADCAAAQRLHRPITAGHAVHGAGDGGPT